MIELLLKRGFNPNLPWGDRGFSFWQQLLNTTYSNYLKGTETQTYCEAIKCAMDCGADPEAIVEVFSRSRLNNTTATDILEKVLSKEQLFSVQLSSGTQPSKS